MLEPNVSVLVRVPTGLLPDVPARMDFGGVNGEDLSPGGVIVGTLEDCSLQEKGDCGPSGVGAEPDFLNITHDSGSEVIPDEALSTIGTVDGIEGAIEDIFSVKGAV